jgi:hypothetical protein
MPPSEPPVAQELPHQELPYQVELRHLSDPARLERVLGRAISAQLAQAIFTAAISDHPGRRITLTHGDTLIADSTG